MESAGVETLIGRLRDDGIAQGRAQAEALVSAAQQQAAEIVAAGKREAEALSAKAKEDAAKLKAAGEDAIRLAMRDTLLSMQGDLLKEFVDRLRRLVKGVLADPEFLQRVILEVAGRSAPETTVKERAAASRRARVAGRLTAQTGRGEAGDADALRALPGRRHAP